MSFKVNTDSFVSKFEKAIFMRERWLGDCLEISLHDVHIFAVDSMS